MQGNLFRDKFYWKKVKRKIANMTGNLFRNKIYWEKLKDKFSQCTLYCPIFENILLFENADTDNKWSIIVCQGYAKGGLLSFWKC